MSTSFSSSVMLAVVLAAGHGTRLGPLTTDRSKAMMPLAGRPMIAYILDMLADGGVDSVVIVVHPDDRELLSYLDASSWSPRLQFAYQERRLGMAHAVERAVPQVQEMEASEFLLASCDNLYPTGHVSNLIARRREDELDAVLTLMWTPREEAAASAVVVLEDGMVTTIIEKPDLGEMPRYGGREDALCVPSLYALSSRILDYLGRVTLSSRGEREFPDALRLLIADGGKVGGERVECRMTLTEPQDLLALNRYMLQNDPSRATMDAELPADTTIVPPVRIETEVDVASGCHIGPDTYLESGCYVGANAVVRRSVVVRGGRVKPNSLVEESVIGLAT